MKITIEIKGKYCFANYKGIKRECFLGKEGWRHSAAIPSGWESHCDLFDCRLEVHKIRGVNQILRCPDCLALDNLDKGEE